jgi:hypothetical protein
VWGLPDDDGAGDGGGAGGGGDDDGGSAAAAPSSPPLFAPPDVLIARGENGSNHEVFRHVQTLAPLARALGGVPIDTHLRQTSDAVAFLAEASERHA